MAALLGGASMLRDTDRVIEIAPPDITTARALRDFGCRRYLGLVAPGDLDRIRSEAGDLADLFAPMTNVVQAIRNNADLLIVHGDHRRLLWYRLVGRARVVAFTTDGAAGREAQLASALHRRARSGAVWGNHHYELRAQPQKRALAARHYTSEVIGLERLPALLAEREIDYVMLRWFDELPYLASGEDLDILVADDHLERLWALFGEQPGTIPSDIYSVSGLPGSEFQSMAYYPPTLSTGILERSVVLPSGYRAPAPLDHFRSLAYHALYHKGEASGLPTSTLDAAPLDDADHDYAAVLGDLAAQLGIDVTITLEGLDDHLGEVGWRPPRDTLSRLAPKNGWIRARFFAGADDAPPAIGLTAFLLPRQGRRRRHDHPSRGVPPSAGLGRARGAPDDTTTQRARSAADIRGGNWGPGPFATSGGAPSVLIVALDHHPSTPSAGQRRQHPGLTNANTLATKLALRDHLTDDVSADERFNPLHSSDGEDDAWHYIELAYPDGLAGLRTTVAERRIAGPVDDAPDTAELLDVHRSDDPIVRRATAGAKRVAGQAVRRTKRGVLSGLGRFAAWRASSVEEPR